MYDKRLKKHRPEKMRMRRLKIKKALRKKKYFKIYYIFTKDIFIMFEDLYDIQNTQKLDESMI